MATSEEVAERNRLIREIDRLTSRINQAYAEQQNLEDELAFVIAAIGRLTVAANRMSREVSNDVGELSSRIEKEALDARDLLHELRDLSEKYFDYKNLSTATRNLTQYTDEYYSRFDFYHDLRRIALGCVMAVDANLISHEGARASLEKAYLANTDYWLAYAITAIVLWWADEKEASERAMKKALVMDERKSTLLFLFCNLKFGRKESAAKWYSYYLGSIHAKDVGEEFQYLMEAYLSGSFGNAHKLEAEVGRKFEDMFSEIPLYDINYNKDISSAAQRFMETKAHATDFSFFYLPEYCSEADSMKHLLTSAEKNEVVAHEYEELAAGEDAYSDVDEKIEGTIYDLLESMDADEEKVYLRIKYNELIIAARGDVSMAETAYAERYPEKSPVSLGDLLQKWAFTENDPRIVPEVRRFAIGRLAGSIRAGFRQFAESYQQKEKERYELHLGKWSFVCSEDEQSIASANYSEHFDKHQLVNYLKDEFVLIWSAMILLGVIGIVAAAAAYPEAPLIVMSLLLVLVGAFLLWRQIADVKTALLKRKSKDLEILRRTLEEMASWRKAYRRADKAFESLTQATHLFEER